MSRENILSLIINYYALSGHTPNVVLFDWITEKVIIHQRNKREKSLLCILIRYMVLLSNSIESPSCLSSSSLHAALIAHRSL